MRLGAVRGHTAVRRLLARAVARDRLPPSLVLSGPDGVGKRQVAVGLAELLNCEAVRDAGDGVPESCGACPPCRRIARGVHADVLAVAPGDTGTIRVDAVRGVVEQAAYRPFEGRRRVVIVDDADRLVAEAQNALLKTLEEPPPASVFLLVTHRPHLLLPTVRSRCPELRFGSLATDEVVDVLVGECGVAPPAAPAVAGRRGRERGAGRSEAGSDERYRTGAGGAIGARARMARALARHAPKRRLEARQGPRRAASRQSLERGRPIREAVTRPCARSARLFRDLQVVSADGDRAWLCERAPGGSQLGGVCRGAYGAERPAGHTRPWIAQVGGVGAERQSAHRRRLADLADLVSRP